MVLLIGNYPPDRQQSMSRFALMMLDGLAAAGVPAELIEPQPFFGRFRYAGRFVTKWLAYVDKFVLFPLRLRRRLKSAPAVVHICDHSNAMYARRIQGIPVVISCHDLLAVRGALGEQTDCPASLTGKLLQRWIVAGLRTATVVACVSKATLEDVRRLVARGEGRPKLELIPLALSYPYRKISTDEAQGRLAQISLLKPGIPFVLHVGSNLRRKNREGVLRIFAQCKGQWNGLLVFAGEPLSEALRSLGRQLGVLDRVVEVPDATSEVLEALYNCATAFLFPSRFEGFGWPIIEAQACGCPVICGDRAPLPEVAGDAGLIHPVEDEESFAAGIIRLTDPEERARWSAKSLRNAQRFSTERMIAEYLSAYQNSGARI
ncbi:MAG TPA: glycosyltransferase family 1 protein [Chthoniobacterales bacterium]|nr:glycosyltransferase family 1 protein [Chthoniobacterales bacterium]